MKCVTHIHREAECYCRFCNQPICGECRDYLGSCIYCAEDGVKDINRSYLKTIILSICTSLIGMYYMLGALLLGEVEGILVALVLLVCFAGVPFGWSVLNKITPNIFLILPLAGWVIYFSIKFAISFLIGWIVAIPKCISMYKSFKINKKIMNNVKRIKNDLKNGNVF